jgi:DNA end-binding protein Ku
MRENSKRKANHAATFSRSARRAVWKGRLSFGLVGIPIELIPAVDAREHVGFHLLHRKDLAPIRYRKFCSKEKIEVPDDDVVRGFEVAKGKWAVVEKDELAAARADAGAGTEAHMLEILSFLGVGRIDPLTFDQPYYIVPDEGGARPFAVFRNALAASDRVGLGRLRLRTREHLAAVVAIPHGLAVILLRPFEEVAAPPHAGSLSAGTGEIKMARLLIDEMSEEALDPAKYPDRYRSALKKLLAKKRAASPAPAAVAGKPEEEGRVIDLMEALRASVGRRAAKSPRKRRVA